MGTGRRIFGAKSAACLRPLIKEHLSGGGGGGGVGGACAIAESALAAGTCGHKKPRADKHNPVQLGGSRAPPRARVEFSTGEQQQQHRGSAAARASKQGFCLHALAIQPPHPLSVPPPRNCSVLKLRARAGRGGVSTAELIFMVYRE